ncbi:MAG: hypothetical protein ACOC56_05080 [Atribacterota bacterium]
MKRLRTVRKWGNTHVVILTQPDMKDLELEVGDEVDISDIVVPEKTKKQKKESKK